MGISRWNGRNGVQCRQWYQEIATRASALACEPAGEYPASNRRRRLLASRNDTRRVSKARRFQLRYANKQSVTFSILSAVFHSAGLDHRGLGVTDFPTGLLFLVVLFLFHSFHSLSPLFLPWMRKICADLPRLAGTKLKNAKDPGRLPPSGIILILPRTQAAAAMLDTISSAAARMRIPSNSRQTPAVLRR